MPKFNEYPTEATPTDDDTMLIFENTSKKNKQTPFSGLWNWMVGKLTNAVIDKLTTENKTVFGAINELNSKMQKWGILRASNADANDAPVPSIIYYTLGNQNTPNAYTYIITMGDNAQDIIQIGIPVSTSNTRMYIRIKASGEWGKWKEINNSLLN